MDRHAAPAVPAMDLTGRAVLLTGASGGLGREIAAFLGSLNARLVLVGRNRERLERTFSRMQGQDHRVEVFDLDRLDEIAGWLRGLAAQVGPFHGLVHAAGKGATFPIYAVNPRKIEDLFRTNLFSAIMLSRAFAEKNCHAPESGIVFVSSAMGLVGKAGVGVYSATKAALMGFARSLAVELAPQRIRVNCIAPAYVQSDMLDGLHRLLLPEQFEALRKTHPLGFGSPADVAAAAAFLLADTGRWITGTTLTVDGGYTAQ